MATMSDIRHSMYSTAYSSGRQKKTRKELQLNTNKIQNKYNSKAYKV